MPRAENILALLGFGLLAGCQTPPVAPAPPVARVWPSPPEEPRIAYVQSLRGPADAGIQPSGFGRFIRWLTGAAAADQLVKPFGVALDEDDNLCVTDTGNHSVSYFDRVHKRWRRWDRVGKEHFLAPVGIAKRGGVLFVADSGLGRVLAFTEDGRLQFAVTNRLARPTGVAVEGDRLFVTDAQRHCVVVFDRWGRYVSEFGKRGTGPGEFNFPTHVAADAAGNLLVTDSVNSRVQVFDATGQWRGQIGKAGDAPGYFSRPKGVAVDSFGHVYVLDANFDNFQIFDLSGRLLLTVGEAGHGPGQFWLPAGLAISRQNEIFVADSYNHRVQVFRYLGKQP